MGFQQLINVGGRKIGQSQPVFIIAEAGVNHNGDMQVAMQLIDAAVNAGADAVKFQAFKVDNLILKQVDKAPYQTKTTSKKESQYEMLKRLEITFEMNQQIQQYCISKDIIFLTTPFDEESLTDVIKLNVPAIKVASTDLTNIPFLRKLAASNLPIFLSTGMSYLAEVQMAVYAIAEHNPNLVLLQCTANYPIDDNEANLAVLHTFREHFDCQLGYSDHSVGIGAAPFAVPMGVTVVEKHFTLNKEGNGPDHAASLTPSELKEFVATIRRVERYMGNGLKKPTLSETKTRAALQKSLVASCRIKAGELFTVDNIIAKRAGGQGVSPVYFDDIVGRAALQDFSQNDVITL